MPEIVIVDERNGIVRDDGSNLGVPEEGRSGALQTIIDALVIVSVGNDGVFVKRGVGMVSLMSTKSEEQMSAEKAQHDLAHRGPIPHDVKPDDNAEMIERFRRAWEGPSNSGTAAVRGV